MAPQATATATATALPTAAPAGGSNDNLSQAEIGGIVGGIVAFVVVVLLIWYWITHTEGYLAYRDTSGTHSRHRHDWPGRRPRRTYESEVSYDETDTEVEEEEFSGAAMSARERRHRHRRRRSGNSGHSGRQWMPDSGDAQYQYAAAMHAQMEAAAMAAAQEQAQQRRPPGVAVSGDYVLNKPPPRFPPTVRQANYLHSVYPQFPGVGRHP